MLPWLLDSFFPRRCVGCGNEGKSWICHNCLAREWLGYPRPVAQKVLALASYQEGVVREAIHGFKYHSLFELADELVCFLWPGPKVAHMLCLEQAVLVPVPTSLKRLKGRGYNQAELLAHLVSKQVGWEVRTDLLIKTSQGSMVGKSKIERIAGAGYALRQGAILPSLPVVLVDDLYTTGSTIRACRQALGMEDATALVMAYDDLR